MNSRIKSAINKYTSLSQSARAGLWFTVCGFIQKGISFITVPVFTRLLTQEQYGAVSVYNTWEQLLSVICTLNLFYGGFNNGMRDYKDERDEYVSAVQSLITVMTAAWVIIYLLGRPIFDPLIGMSPVLMLTMFLQVLATAALSLWSARQRYDFRYRALVIITAANAVISSAASVAAIMIVRAGSGAADYGAEAKILANAAVIVAVCGGVYFYNLKKGKTFFDRDIWKTAFLFNLPLLPHYLSTMVLNQADRIMIDRMVGSGAAGVYSVAYSAAMVLNIFATAVNNAFAPWLYRRLGKKEYKGVSGSSNLLFAGFALILFMLIAFAPECIYILGGKEYSEAAVIVPPVASSLFFVFMYQIYANVEFYYKKNKFIAIASVSGAVLNIVLNYFGIKMFGYVAAGYTTLICYVLFGFAHFFFMKKICKAEMPGTNLFRAGVAFAIGAALIAASLCMLPLYSHPFIRYSILLAAALVIVICRGKITKTIKAFKEN